MLDPASVSGSEGQTDQPPAARARVTSEHIAFTPRGDDRQPGGYLIAGIRIHVAGPQIELSPRVRAALTMLLDAHAYAADTGADVWEYAVEWPELQRLQVTSGDARWLVRRGWLAHAFERSDGGTREWKLTATDTFSSDSRLVLTEFGLQAARQAARGHPLPLGGERAAGLPQPIGFAAAEPSKSRTPHWDRIRRELRVGDCCVKKYRVPAPNQEIILAVFQEEGWPPRVDDPLPPKQGADSQRRLHDTINSLNRNQRYRGVRFFADGLGRGVGWELLEPKGC